MSGFSTIIVQLRQWASWRQEHSSDPKQGTIVVYLLLLFKTRVNHVVVCNW